MPEGGASLVGSHQAKIKRQMAIERLFRGNNTRADGSSTKCSPIHTVNIVPPSAVRCKAADELCSYLLYFKIRWISIIKAF